MARLPAVAGRFYPNDPQALLEEVQRHLEPKLPKVSAKGVIVPHGKRKARKEKNRSLKDEAVFLKPFFRVEAFADELFKLDFFL